MNKLNKQLDYPVTALVLMCTGLLFLFLNRGLNTYLVLHLAIFQISQSLIFMIMAALSIYREMVQKAAPQPAAGSVDERENKARETVDSVNATMLLAVVTLLVSGFYMFTARLPQQEQLPPAPIHMVVCVVVFILFACVEKWWSMKLSLILDSAAICNLMVINKIAVALTLLDMVMSFTGLFHITAYVDCAIIGLWLYMAAFTLASVIIKVLRHSSEIEFHLYVMLPFYRCWGTKHSGALDWLEQNTGISMRSLWSLKFLKTSLPRCALCVLMLLWLSTCLVQVEAYQQCALYRFGGLTSSDILNPGLHLKLPIPFETAKIYDVTHAKSMIVGYEGDTESRNNLWTMAHKGEEQKLLLGAGRELVAINLKVIYRISDLHAYLTNYSSPENVLNAKGYEIVMHSTVNTDINTVMSVDRSELSHEIEAELAAYAEEAGLGLEIMGVTLASIHPPIEIASIYQNVVSAGIQKRAAVLTAEGSSMAARELANASRQISVNQAGITRDERVSAANAEVMEYNASIEAYQIDPPGYQMERYLDTFQLTLSGQRKYLIGRDVDESSLYSGFLQQMTGPKPPQGEQPEADNSGKDENR